MSRHIRRWGLALVAACVPALAAEPDDVRERMAAIFASMQVVLPLSANEAAWRAPENRESILAGLETLAADAGLLASHAVGSDAGSEFLGESLTRNAREALRRYREGRYGSAEFLFRRTTELCVACHARLPSDRDSPLSLGFVEGIDLASAPVGERAYLLLATRRFDEALVALESLVLSPDIHPAELLGPLTDYLTVCVRVEGDLARPVATLEAFARRPDLWRYLREDVESWIRALRSFGLHPLPEPTLEEGRRLIRMARLRITFPSDRQGLVHYIVASSVLQRFIERAAAEGGLSGRADVAEAYYLLGLTEIRIGRDFWVSQAEHYLESAIRLAPREASARRAYALLEEETLLGYSGSGGVQVPQDVGDHLASLRRLIEAAPDEPPDAGGDREEREDARPEEAGLWPEDAGVAPGEEDEPVEGVRPPALPGESLYLQYCAACHGTFADGKGPVAPFLAVAPTDLTRLEERHGAPLPFERIAAFIDGREEVRGHGPREMPVWGERLYEDLVPVPGVEAARAAVIQAILEYLQTLQNTSVSRLRAP